MRDWIRNAIHGAMVGVAFGIFAIVWYLIENPPKMWDEETIGYLFGFGFALVATLAVAFASLALLILPPPED